MSTKLSGTLDDRIRAVYDELSRGHRSLVDCIVGSRTAAAFLTARQFASAAGVSESTVVRLAPKLGYDGFPSLRVAIQAELLSLIDPKPPLNHAIETLPRDPVAIMRQVLQNDITSIQNTLLTVDVDAFCRAVDLVREARTVYLFGHRLNFAHAFFAAMRLRLVLHNTRLLSNQFGDLPDQLLALNSGDVLIAVSLHRHSTDTPKVLRFAKKTGVATILVTDTPLFPLARLSDIVLAVPRLHSPRFHSSAPPLCLMNALIAAVVVPEQKRASYAIDQAYHTIDEFAAFLPNDDRLTHMENEPCWE